MKKILLIIALTISGYSSYANSYIAATDTLWGFSQFWTYSVFPVIVGPAQSGYITGTSIAGDKEIAQEFKLPSSSYTSYNVVGVVLQFGINQYHGDTTQHVDVNLRNMNGIGTTSIGSGNPAPGSIVSSKRLNLSDINTGNQNIILFDSLVTVNSDYGIGVDISTINFFVDTVALFSSGINESVSDNLSWTKQFDDTWLTFLAPTSWQKNIDIAIFPIIDVTTGIDIKSKTNNLKIYPNPSSGNFTIDNKNVEIISVELFSFTGQLLQSFNSLNYKRKVNIDLSNFKNGQYLLAITDKNGNKIFHKINLTK